MFVTSAVSHLGGWTFLREKHPDLLDDIAAVAAELVFDPSDPRVLFKQVESLLAARAQPRQGQEERGQPIDERRRRPFCARSACTMLVR